MLQARFADRLDAATYEDDGDVVGIYASDPAEEKSLCYLGACFVA